MSNRRPVQRDADRDDDDVRKIDKGYTWESNLSRSWDLIVEDPTTGRLKSFEREEQIGRKRRRDEVVAGVRRGIIRYTVLVLDTSVSMRETDLKPSRMEAVSAACGEFIREYFDQNPVSQLSVITTRDATAQTLSSFSSNPDVHIDAIQEALRLGPYGDASLQNALAIARSILLPIPPYGAKEVLVVFGSLATCDPGNIHDTIGMVVADKIRCSIVGLGAEMSILKAMADRTSGTYTVAMGEDHFGELLGDHITPPATSSARTPASLIRMGFPVLKRLPAPRQYWNTSGTRLGRSGYECPRCKAWLNDVPCECILCGLTLVSSPHLARSYHHLFPVPKFIALAEDADHRASGDIPEDRMTDEDAPANGNGALAKVVRCTGCLKVLERDTALRLQCPRCSHIFCLDCDAFIHDGLHNCPSCGGNDKSILSS